MSELPDRLGERFVLGPLIGRGTCSEVHRAHDLLLDRAAAVKIFPVADDPRVEREVSLLASLDHPSLVGVYDVGQIHGRAFVVMALFEGGSLADRLRHGPLPLGETILAVSAIADALAHVHRAGVLHRDVTPRNILFDADGRAHLSDFGVAFVADSPRITDTGIVVGSAPYLAPEQVRGDEVGPPADIYALALVMLEALTARPAYTGTPLEAAVARLQQLPPIPEGLGDDVSDLLVEMTADDPADRPDAESVRLRLRRAALAREVGTGPQRVVVPAARVAEFEPARLPTRALMIVGAAAMSILLAGTVVAASTWTVRDVSASANPPASLSPSASTPLGRALPPAPDGSGDADESVGSDSSHDSRSGSSDDSGSRSAQSVRGDETAGRFWSAVAGSSPHSVARPAAIPATRAPEVRAPQQAPPSAADRETPRSEDHDRSAPQDLPDVTDPAGSSDPSGSSDGTGHGLLPDLPGIVGDVTRGLPAPVGRSSSNDSANDSSADRTSRSSAPRSSTSSEPSRSSGGERRAPRTGDDSTATSTPTRTSTPSTATPTTKASPSSTSRTRTPSTKSTDTDGSTARSTTNAARSDDSAGSADSASGVVDPTTATGALTKPLGQALGLLGQTQQ